MNLNPALTALHACGEKGGTFEEIASHFEDDRVQLSLDLTVLLMNKEVLMNANTGIYTIAKQEMKK